MSIGISLLNKEHEIREGKNDYEEEKVRLKNEGKEHVYLSTQQLTYEEGDYFEINVSEPNQFVVVRLDMTLPPTLIFIKDKIWRYELPISETYQEAVSDTAFKGNRHYVSVRYARPFEIDRYQNLTENPHDLNEFTGAYPHAHANVETRNDATFFARNAIDGIYANNSHGSFPYQSWGINQQPNAELTIDFGHKVTIDALEVTLRADFPHDSHWIQGTAVFSDGQEVTLSFEKTEEPQYFEIEKVTTSLVTFKNLIKHYDDSPFPALTQLAAFGRHIR